MDALRLGDVPAAKAALKAYLAEAPEGQRDAYQKSLAASVRSSAPIRVGAAGEARRELFLRWALRNLSAEDMRRVRTIDTRYRDTAKKIGLFNPKPVSSKTMATTVAKLGLFPKRSVRWADL